MQHGHAMEYFLALKIKRKEILTNAATWKNLEEIVLSESQKDRCYMIPFIGGNQGSQIHGHRKQNDVFQGPGEGEMENCCVRGTEFQFGKIKMFQRQMGCLHNNVRVLNAPELHSSKWLKR